MPGSHVSIFRGRRGLRARDQPHRELRPAHRGDGGAGRAGDPGAAPANVFTVHYPDEERPAARPLRTAPCHDRLKALGGVFGQKFGWERANWFAPKGVEAVDD